MTGDARRQAPAGREAPGKRRAKQAGSPSKTGVSDSRPEGQMREKLLRAALTLFTRRGYSATTVRELVAAAGVTKPVLYYYFGSKEGLFLELMRTHFGRLEAVADVYRRGAGG
ncbi:MAG: helix-turn-helix domain-containing protein, partial [Thermodesulfobacteriota bacterium]